MIIFLHSLRHNPISVYNHWQEAKGRGNEGIFHKITYLIQG